MAETLTIKTLLPDGRVIAVNGWATGWQELVFPTRDAFDRAEEAVARGEKLPAPTGYTPF
jgi:hypothetical protein